MTHNTKHFLTATVTAPPTGGEVVASLLGRCLAASCRYCRILIIVAYYHHYRIRKYLQKFSQKTSESNKFRSTYHGGILIEFAFSIPILISLLFFVNDHFRFYELKNKIKTSAYLAASMLQQLKNTKANKQLTKQDLAKITYASCLNLFHTNSMFYPWSLGILYRVNFYHVKREAQNNYNYFFCSIDTGNGGINFGNGMYISPFVYRNYTQTQVEAIHADLICNKNGDERLLIECCYVQVGFFKSKLGFFIIEPKENKNLNILMKYKLVIVPKPRLFSEKQ